MPTFELKRVKVQYNGYYENRKLYYQVTISPGNLNLDLLNYVTVSHKHGHREQHINHHNGRFSFKTYTRKEELHLLVRFYLKDRTVVEKDLVLKNKGITDEKKKPIISVKKVIVSETDEELSFKLKLSGDLERVRYVHYDVHPSFGRYATYRSRSRRRSFTTPVFTTYAEGWRTGQITITLYDGTVIKKKGILIK